MSFILRPQEDPHSAFNDYRRQHWARAASQEEAGNFRLWERGGKFPTHSIPALVAAKCLELQGEELSHRYHFLLLDAFFGENRDISDLKILTDLAGRAGGDVEAFTAAWESGKPLEKVWTEHHLATEKYFINSIPTVIIGEERLVGAVPRQAYREAVERQWGKVIGSVPN